MCDVVTVKQGVKRVALPGLRQEAQDAKTKTQGQILCREGATAETWRSGAATKTRNCRTGTQRPKDHQGRQNHVGKIMEGEPPAAFAQGIVARMIHLDGLDWDVAPSGKAQPKGGVNHQWTQAG